MRGSDSEVIEIGSQPEAMSRLEWLRKRILAIVDRGVPKTSWRDGEWREDPQAEWPIPPGRMPRWALRQAVGGRVRTPEFNWAVETLLTDGEFMEAWLEQPDAPAASHLLVRPGVEVELPKPVARIKGRRDLIGSSPWARALAKALAPPKSRRR